MSSASAFQSSYSLPTALFTIATSDTSQTVSPSCTCRNSVGCTRCRQAVAAIDCTTKSAPATDFAAAPVIPEPIPPSIRSSSNVTTPASAQTDAADCVTPLEMALELFDSYYGTDTQDLCEDLHGEDYTVHDLATIESTELVSRGIAELNAKRLVAGIYYSCYHHIRNISELDEAAEDMRVIGTASPSTSNFTTSEEQFDEINHGISQGRCNPDASAP